MEDAKQWLERYKQQFILAGVIGMMLAPFLWPFFLAIIFQVLSLAIPIIVVRAIIQKVRKEKTNEKKRNCEEPYTGNADFHTERNVSGKSNSKPQEAAKTDTVPKGNKETGKESLENHTKSKRSMSDASCIALMWYRLEGRERILRLMRKLEKEGIWNFSISPEGICSVRKENGYCRVGALRSFPHREVKILEKELLKDHIRTTQKGKYLWLSWGKECRH